MRCKLECRSKKNSKQLFKSKKTGRYFPSTSNIYKDFENAFKNAIYMSNKPKEIIDEKIVLNIHFGFKNNRKRDISNMYQGVEDMLQSTGIIKNDNLITGHDFSTITYGVEPYIKLTLFKDGVRDEILKNLTDSQKSILS